MLRRLCLICLCLAPWGCNRSTSPPLDGSATRGESTPAAAGQAAARPVETASAEGDSDSILQTAGTDRAGGATADATIGADGKGGEKKTAESDGAAKNAAAGSVEAAMTRFRRARTPKARQRAAAELEKALAGESDHVEGLLQMVKALELLIEDADDEDEPTEGLHHKQVAFAEKALRAEPELLKIRGVKPWIAEIYFEDGRALAREKKPAKSLAQLDKAVQYGYPLAELDDEDDLDAVRKLPEFAALVTQARERIEEEVARLFVENKPFKFSFDLEDVTGKKVSTGNLKGKVLIVDFWGTWCPPCKREIPHFNALDREYREKGLQIVGLNVNEGDDLEEAANRVRDFCAQQGVRYPCALANDEIIEQVGELDVFPTTLFVDRTGKVRLKTEGYRDLFFLRTIVEKLLNEKGAAAAKAADRKAE